MQEEVENRTVTLTVNTAKMTGRLLKEAIQKYRALEHCVSISAERRQLLEEVKCKGETYGKMSRLYGDMRNRENEFIDLSEPYIDESETVKTLKEYGFEKFAFSSNWSEAIENAWNFQKSGCTLEGMIEVNGTGKAFMSNDYEKVHALIFRIN